MGTEERNLIVEYVLTSEENLLLSSQIVKAFDSVLEKLAKAFFEQLENELLLMLGDEWRVYNDIKDDIMGKKSFSISKKMWNGLYAIGLYPERTRLRDFDFYVWRKKEIISSPNKVINKLINENYKKGNIYENGDWWQFVDNCYLNWNDEETLIKLYEKNEMVSYFKEQFIKIKNIVELTIDNEIIKYI